MKKTWPLITTATFTAILLAGCSSGDSTPENGDASSQAGTASASTSTGAPDEADSAEAKSKAGVASVDLSKVFVEQEFQLPGTKDETKFGIHSLVVDGDTMKLKIVMTPDFSSITDSETVSLFKMTGESGTQPLLIDRENLKEYSVIRDGPKQWTADRVFTESSNGEPAVWWGVYAAPEDDIDSVDIRVLDGMPEFTNVPIER